MANLDLYTTIRSGPDPNRMGHNIRGSFDPMHYASFRAIDISLTTGTLQFEILTTAAANNVAVPGTKSDVQGQRKR